MDERPSTYRILSAVLFSGDPISILYVVLTVRPLYERGKQILSNLPNSEVNFVHPMPDSFHPIFIHSPVCSLLTFYGKVLGMHEGVIDLRSPKLRFPYTHFVTPDPDHTKPELPIHTFFNSRYFLNPKLGLNLLFYFRSEKRKT
jgi:hypothetical protein